MSISPPLCFYRAATLSERVAARRTDAPNPHASDPAISARRLARWRALSPLRDEARFAERLSTDGVSEQELMTILGEPLEAVRDRCSEPTPWLSEMSTWLHAPAPAARDIPWPKRLLSHPSFGFLVPLEPLLGRAIGRVDEALRQLVDGHPDPPFDIETARNAFFVHLPMELLTMVRRTMALELQVASLEGSLEGTTPEERFRSFVKRLQRPDVLLALFEEYPLLARRIVERVETWVEVGLECLGHLVADWDAVCAAFSPHKHPGRLVQIRQGMGDPHRGGRTVNVLGFSSDLRIVYKPRSLAVDIHFGELLDTANKLGCPVLLRSPRILERGAHGWMEFIAHSGCSSQPEVERFHFRLGAFLALLYALEATDFHFQNVVACGEHPVLVDLESLLHPHLRILNERSLQRYEQQLYRSVLGVGLLPQRVWANIESEGIDISGLTSLSAQVSPAGVPELTAVGTDGMRIVRRRKSMGQGQNRPLLNGAELDALPYAQPMEEGFVHVYRLIETHRTAFLAEGGPIDAFRNDEVRVLLRPTLLYTATLEDNLHPDVLRDALDRDRFFDRLWVDLEHYPFLGRVAHEERRMLEIGDIPIFITRPGVRDVWSGTGERIDDLFDEPGLALVRQRIEALSAGDLERQRWFIRASMAIQCKDPHEPASWPRPDAPSAPSSPEQWLLAACHVGERLASLVDTEGPLYGLTLVRGWWALKPLGLDLYGGLPGLALFFAHLGSVTSSARFTEIAERMVAHMQLLIDQEWHHLASAGAFDGWAGVVYTLSHLGLLWQRSALWRHAEQIALEKLPPLIEQDSSFSIVSGTAGALMVLVGLCRCMTSEPLHALAVQCGERLLQGATTAPSGLSWQPANSPVSQVGFAFGTTGIACALGELHALTRKPRLEEAMQLGFAHATAPGSRHTGASSGASERRMDSGWCRGIAGIGLGCSRLLRNRDEPNLRGELAVALASLSAHSPASDHSACHGLAGETELFVHAARDRADPRCTESFERHASLLAGEVLSQGPRCGVPLGVQTPGFMNGLAGIGYALLRCAAPARVPAVLSLDLPERSTLQDATG